MEGFQAPMSPSLWTEVSVILRLLALREMDSDTCMWQVETIAISLVTRKAQSSPDLNTHARVPIVTAYKALYTSATSPKGSLK